VITSEELHWKDELLTKYKYVSLQNRSVIPFLRIVLKLKCPVTNKKCADTSLVNYPVHISSPKLREYRLKKKKQRGYFQGK